MELEGTLGSNGLMKGRIFKVLFESRLERREGDSQVDMNEQRKLAEVWKNSFDKIVGILDFYSQHPGC